jgi:hypothetical protein
LQIEDHKSTICNPQSAIINPQLKEFSMHDTHMHQWIPPTAIHLVTGTWTMTAGAVGNTIAMSCAQADSTRVATYVVDLPSNDGPEKGACIISIDIYWNCLTLAMDAVTALIHKVTLPLDTAAIGAPESLAFAYSADHDTAGKRLTLAKHTMTLTPTVPIWIEDDQVIQVQVTYDAGATSDLTLFGARVNYTLRLGE